MLYSCVIQRIIADNRGTAFKGRGTEAQAVPEYLAVQVCPLSLRPLRQLTYAELLGASLATSKGFQSILDTSEVTEVRKWELYRAYPGIAQGNL